MDRRNLLTLLGSGLALAGLSHRAQAMESSGSCQDPLAGGLYYTAEKPGRWKAKVASHSPKVSVEGVQGDKRMVHMTTEHPFQDYAHYIVKHLLLDSSMNVLGENFFNPMEKSDKALSDFTIPGSYQGKLYAISVCNLHDAWLTVLDIA